MIQFLLTIVDVNPEFCQMAKNAFLNTVTIENKSFADMEFDCLICPGNPAGYLVSGMDRAVEEYFGPDVSINNRVVQSINEQFNGKQPAGTSLLIRTDNTYHPYIAYTPTFPKRDTSAYLGMKAALQIIDEHNQSLRGRVWEKTKKEDQLIHSVVCPGLGTYVGCLPYDVQECAKQMAQAYFEYKNILTL